MTPMHTTRIGVKKFYTYEFGLKRQVNETVWIEWDLIPRPLVFRVTNKDCTQ